MCKIGIISLYANSKNYGGLLQAYAMTRITNRFCFNAEQIQFKYLIDNKNKKLKNNSIIYAVKVTLYNIICKIILIGQGDQLKKRNIAMERFKKIPHSEMIYNQYNISECDKYDIYISGSDQVWNMAWYTGAYALDFVPDTKYKFSYAASMPNTNISKEEENIIKEPLMHLNKISVREKATKYYLDKLLNRETYWVLDPTLLLDADEWDDICSERIIKDKYIFTYFLSNDRHMRKEAERFAKLLNIKIVHIPHVGGMCYNDVFYADIKMNIAGPAEFISLVKYAEYVLTDSFHATVFSNIYNTPYFVFPRGNMNERIMTLVNLLDERERFHNADANYMYSMKDRKLHNFEYKIHDMKQYSLDFLMANIKAGEEKLLKNEN